MLERLLPAAVATAHAYADDLPGRLYPEEEPAVARAVPKRRAEYRTARLCARQALTALGAPVGPITTGHRGAPRWPAGVVGSLTHCDGYRGAAVAWARTVAALGVDAEPNAALPAGVGDLISSPAERDHQDRLAADAPQVHWDRLVFCAKEALFKAWFPVTAVELTFREAEIEFRPDPADAGPGREPRGGFQARLLVDPGRFPAASAGRWVCRDGLLVAVLLVTPGELGPAAGAVSAGPAVAPRVS